MGKAVEEGVDFDDLADSGGERYIPTEARINAAILKTFPTELQMRVKAREQKTRKKHKVITGRQAVWMVFDWYKTESHMSITYGYNDFMELKYGGDAYMYDFLATPGYALWPHPSC